jgi:TrkA domain protein
MVKDIEETPLPGVGVRFAFESSSGQRIAVLHHHGGRREVFLQDPDETDASQEVLDLDEDDGWTLAELLGGSRVTREIDRLQQAVEGLAIDWLPVEPGSPAAGRTIGQLQIRRTTGVTVVTILRGNQALPAPGPEFSLESGDTLVVFGAPGDIRRVHDLVRV